MTADRLDGGVAHHVDDAHQLLPIPGALSAMRGAGMPEGEEVAFLIDERVTEDAAGDRHEAVPLLADAWRQHIMRGSGDRTRGPETDGLQRRLMF